MLLAGCFPPAQAGMPNQISFAPLRTEQQDIVNLLSFGGHRQNILLFDFTTEEYFTTIELWVEVYEYGLMIELHNSVSLSSGEVMPMPFWPFGVDLSNGEVVPAPLDGQIAVIVNEEADSLDHRWTLIISENNKMAVRVPDNPAIIGGDMTSRIISTTVEPVAIYDSVEIILMATKFYRGGFSVTHTHIDRQVYLEQPELLERYPHAHIIKAKFSR